jgi:hypothetical protein
MMCRTFSGAASYEMSTPNYFVTFSPKQNVPRVKQLGFPLGPVRDLHLAHLRGFVVCFLAENF